jgi:uncharacterized protein
MHNAYRLDSRGRGSFDRVIGGWEALQRRRVDVNILCAVHAANAGHPLEVYRFFRDELSVPSRAGPLIVQFIPIVERNTPESLPFVNDGRSERPDRQMGRLVSRRSVEPQQFGSFLVDIFEEWVRRDMGRVYVQIFDVTLAAYLGQYLLCTFAPTCGTALALEHNGDLYACDHYVDPDYLLGNILEAPLSELLVIDQQHRFGLDKRDTLPRCCRECEVRSVCHGGCPRNRFTRSPDGEPGLNYLCAGYMRFFHHVNRPMRIMADLLRQNRAPAEIQGWYAARDLRLARELSRAAKRPSSLW